MTIVPIPSGTRDVLPDEMRELRAIGDGLRAVFEEHGYGEIATPALEYEEVLQRGDDRAGGAAYRVFNEHGEVLVLRSDMTIPIARLVATRYREVEPPFRFCYFAHAYRAAERGVGEPREFLQGGLELIGAPSPNAEAELLTLTLAALDEAGLRRHRVGVGDGSLYRRLMGAFGVPENEHLPLLERADGPVAEAVEGLRRLYELLAERGVAERLIFDLGLVRELGYYTGAVFEVYDPAVGFTLGGGGRYDELVGRFGRPLPACGIALDVQRVHLAQAAEETVR